ncbi:hypothetical protein Poli38472_008522 [Pythium oligandrum]|uniref:SUZ domain-containing protein n=1 Tax=Pythium oligandrum TaxID=41045 RepID=A0A8K1FCI7_PYTOL|nr:hypothetical protein Poli38472_008522 [Pythium oligandrum]|eukprot:TMW55874.1 hypothetical protein Poli38472_008522 [Pythium oligandrum]
MSEPVATMSNMKTDVEEEWETTEVKAVLPRRVPSTARDEDLDAATAALNQMRLMPPPPAQDGGAFDGSDPFQRRPTPTQHALFDPNSAYEQPVSPAAATAASARFGPLDPVLLAGLENPRERLSVLKFEDQIVRFIKNPRENQLSFPPLSSYHRLIIHRLAERCCLEHQTGDYNPYSSQGYDGNASRVVTLFKTSQTVIPRVLLIDLSAEKQQPAVTPASAPKIMMRKRNTQHPGNGAAGGRGGADGRATQRSIEDRERAYAEARARIFGEDSSSTSASDATTSPPSSDNNASRVNKNGASTAGGAKLGGSHQASGPDGTRGFVRGRNGSPAATSAGNTTPPTNNATETRAAKPQQNWKESKVLWRNREQEMNDPDFTRNHDAYRPSREGSGGYYGGGGPRYGSGGNGGYYHDQPRSYGQHGGGFGGGRGRGSGEYNRIDTMQRPPAPPSSEYYRHPGPINPPPPPPGGQGFRSDYSPHGRPIPVYAPPPPQSAGIGRRTAVDLPSGGYNDDFPPLGK